MCLLSEKGPDNKPVMVTSVSDLIKHFGEPNIRRYSQAWYVARAYLETLNNLWVMRVLPKNAKYATLALKLSDPSTNITKYSVTKDANNKEVLTLISDDSKTERLLSVEDLNTNKLSDILSEMSDGGSVTFPATVIDRTASYTNDITLVGAAGDSVATEDERADGETVFNGPIAGVNTVRINGMTLSNYALTDGFADVSEFEIRNSRILSMSGGTVSVPESYSAENPVEGATPEKTKTVTEDSYNFINIEDIKGVNTVPSMASLLSGEDSPADIIFYPYGRGEYYNCLGIKLTKAKKSYDNAFILDIYEMPKDSSYPNLVESFEVSFDVDARDISGSSLFIKDVLDMYSDYIRCEISDNIGKYGEESEDTDASGNSEVHTFNYDDLATADIVYLKGGSDGTMYDKNGNLDWNAEVTYDDEHEEDKDKKTKKENMVMALTNAYMGLNINPETGEYNEEITDTENMDFTVAFDAGWPTEVKDAIESLCDSRQSCFGFLDNGIASNNGNRSAQVAIDKRLSDHNYNNYKLALYEPYTKLYDSFTGTYYWATPIIHAVSCFARTARDYNVWWAFAGLSRGSCSGIRDYRYKLAGGYRDMFKQNELNPIVRFNQGGDVIWGNWSATCSAMKSCSNF